MQPELLLRYALERITLPSGEGMFRWLTKQTVMQQFFLYFFWFLKVKFFQKEVGNEEAEEYLLRLVSLENVRLMEIFTNRANAEHEKDFIFRFLPYVLAHAVYFGFYYLCPGSRHLYTRTFRKTTLLQIVQVMHGVQLCPISVKVTWAKLFPDEEREEEEAGGGEETESFPTNIAFPAGVDISTLPTFGVTIPIKRAVKKKLDKISSTTALATNSECSNTS